MVTYQVLNLPTPLDSLLGGPRAAIYVPKREGSPEWGFSGERREHSPFFAVHPDFEPLDHRLLALARDGRVGALKTGDAPADGLKLLSDYAIDAIKCRRDLQTARDSASLDMPSKETEHSEIVALLRSFEVPASGNPSSLVLREPAGRVSGPWELRDGKYIPGKNWAYDHDGYRGGVLTREIGTSVHIWRSWEEESYREMALKIGALKDATDQRKISLQRLQHALDDLFRSP